MTPEQAGRLLKYLTPKEQAELDALLAADIQAAPWRPLPGPQTMAYESEADVIGYGGAAGGGKTDLACGLALTKHTRVQMFRREGPQLLGIIDRMAEIVGHRTGLGGKPAVWDEPVPGVKVEFGSVPNLGDESKFQGRPKDLLVIDEAANFLEAQVRFLKGWVRTTKTGQRTRTLMCFNPPTTTEGRWVIDFFGPWLNKRHKLFPSAPGQLRYVYVDPVLGEDVWIEDDDPRSFVFLHGERCYDFDPEDYRPEDIIKPESRTFIPARVTDNPFLVGTGYLAQLQALPEPLRSQMLKGDFSAGMEDDPFQVIPTAWAEAAMARWRERVPRGEMMSMGVDVARGGKDNTIIATRHMTETGAPWIDKLKVHEGKATPTGQATAGLVLAERRDNAPVHIDVIGVGASPYDILRDAKCDVYGVNVSETATSLDRTGRLSFFNLRSQMWWKIREALDPDSAIGLCLPDDPDLLAELCAPKWEMSGMKIKVESREEIVKRTGRSPDRATAVGLALFDTPKVHNIVRGGRERAVADSVLQYDPTRFS